MRNANILTINALDSLIDSIKTIFIHKKYVHNIDCGRGCLDCGARMNRALSSPEMLCLLRHHREKYGLAATQRSIDKICNIEINEPEPTLF